MTPMKKRIVVKIGTSAFTGSLASASRSGVLEARAGSTLAGLAAQVSALRAEGLEVILVTSGAIGAGMARLHWSRRPEAIQKKQAAAAVGQVSLMRIYEDLFRKSGLRVAQVLLTRSDFEDRRRYLNARRTLLTLLDLGAVPVINENDTVAVEEIQFGDNDRLSALVAAKIDADLLVILSDVDGLFRSRAGREGGIVSVVPKITPEIERLAWKGVKGKLGTGGMTSKIEAARIATASGVTTVIANAAKPGVLRQAAEGGEAGTRFVSLKTLGSKEKWILFGAVPKGEIAADSGAARALKQFKKSLLPAGVRDVTGFFRKGDVVRIRSEEGGEFARGIVSFSSEDIRKIMGGKTAEIKKVLGSRAGGSEVVHRDSLAILP